MLDRYLTGCKRHLATHHFQCGMSQDLLQREHIATVNQVIGGKGVPAEMRVQPFHAGTADD